MRRSKCWFLSVPVALACCGAFGVESTVPVKFSGGHETDRRDGGRPVVLVAAGLGVRPEVFREAFSNVRPAKNGKPSGEEARRNKEVLMKALSPHGITNERLDEVSNYYRYQPQSGRLWPTTAAKAHAVVEDGKVKRIAVDEGGAGYSSPPTATIEGMDSVKLKVNLSFGKDLKKNGAVEAVDVE